MEQGTLFDFHGDDGEAEVDRSAEAAEDSAYLEAHHHTRPEDLPRDRQTTLQFLLAFRGVKLARVDKSKSRIRIRLPKAP
jgi:hypothetical protein